jgi:ribosomal protein S18 acetylase RimI-like enzyme
MKKVSELEIGELVTKDSSALDSLKEDGWTEADKEHYGDPLPDFTKSEFIITAHDGERYVGYVSFIYDLGVARIDSVLVTPEYQGQGLGQRLMLEAESRVKRLGAHKVYLETGANWKARRLYEKLGYEVRATLPDYWGHLDFVFMDKNL